MQKSCLLNYDPYTVVTLYLSRCNFRCPFCHNPDLIKKEKELPSIPKQDVLDYIDSKRKWYDGVCITGGEPTLHKGLPEFCSKLKSRKLLVKLDTNGTNPILIKQLLDEKLVDYIAMDIKSSFDKYEEVTKVKTNIDDVKQSIQLIKENAPDYEFRITPLPDFHNQDTLVEIGKSLKGSKKFVMQQYHKFGELLDPEFDPKSFPDDELEKFKTLLLPYFDEVLVKNV